MPIKVELKPCPFCGEEAIMCQYREEEKIAIVGCSVCQARIQAYASSENALEDLFYRWNLREIENCSCCRWAGTTECRRCKRKAEDKFEMV